VLGVVDLQEYELRKHARSEGRRYCDPQVLTYQAERMPEQIRLKVGGVTPQQMAVYEEFSRSIPGFIPMGGSLSGELPAGTAADSSSNTTPTAASYVVKPLPVIVLCCIAIGNKLCRYLLLHYVVASYIN